MLGGADNPNGELPSYITGADIITMHIIKLLSIKTHGALSRAAITRGRNTNRRKHGPHPLCT